MKISLFPNAFTSQAFNLDVTWKDVVSELTNCKPTPTQDKRHTDTWSPAEFDKTKDNPIRVHLAVLDFDELTAEQFNQVLKAAEGYECLVYSSFSHGWKKTGYSFRLVLNIDRPVEEYEWQVFRAALNSMFGDLGDKACDDFGRVYFAPRYPEGQEQHAFAWDEQGESLKVDPLLQTTVRRKLVSDDVYALAAKLKARRPQLSTALMALREGAPYATPGERDTMIFQIAAALVKEYPDLEVESAVQWFARSTEAMTRLNPETPGLDVVREKFERLLESVDLGLITGDRIGQALGAPGRKHPYSEVELDAIAAAAQCTREELTHHWVIQRKNVYYTLVAGEYRGPYQKDDFLAAASRDLAPAHSAGVELTRVMKDGTSIPKSELAIMRDYGTVADEIVIDITKPERRYLAEERIFQERGAVLRDLPPEYHDDVAGWLAELGREHQHALRSWLAAVMWLEVPACALFLTGAKGAGKSLLAHGVSRLWKSVGPSELEDAMRSVGNDAMLACPLLFADESIPSGYNGKNRTQEIRKIIQGRSHSINRKYLPLMTVKGAIRLIIAANNEQVLNLSNDLNENDLKAITDRFLHIPVYDSASTFLKSLPCGGQSFVLEDKLPKHIHWLARNYDWEPKGRFLIEGGGDNLYLSLINTVGMRGKILNWLFEWLVSQNRALPGVFLDRGCVVTTVRGITSNWTMLTDERRPSNNSVFLTLQRLSSFEEVMRVKGRYQKCFFIDSSHLKSWSLMTGGLPEQEIDNLLNNSQRCAQ